MEVGPSTQVVNASIIFQLHLRFLAKIATTFAPNTTLLDVVATILFVICAPYPAINVKVRGHMSLLRATTASGRCARCLRHNALTPSCGMDARRRVDCVRRKWESARMYWKKSVRSWPKRECAQWLASERSAQKPVASVKVNQQVNV